VTNVYDVVCFLNCESNKSIELFIFIFPESLVFLDHWLQNLPSTGYPWTWMRHNVLVNSETMMLNPNHILVNSAANNSPDSSATVLD